MFNVLQNADAPRVIVRWNSYIKQGLLYRYLTERWGGIMLHPSCFFCFVFLARGRNANLAPALSLSLFLSPNCWMQMEGFSKQECTCGDFFLKCIWARVGDRLGDIIW